jgi:hypothetical protein
MRTCSRPPYVYTLASPPPRRQTINVVYAITLSKIENLHDMPPPCVIGAPKNVTHVFIYSRVAPNNTADMLPPSVHHTRRVIILPRNPSPRTLRAFISCTRTVRFGRPPFLVAYFMNSPIFTSSDDAPVWSIDWLELSETNDYIGLWVKTFLLMRKLCAQMQDRSVYSYICSVIQQLVYIDATASEASRKKWPIFSCKNTVWNRLLRDDRGGILSPWTEQFITLSFYLKGLQKLLKMTLCRPQNIASPGANSQYSLL